MLAAEADGQFGRYWCSVEVKAKGGGSRIWERRGLDPSEGGVASGKRGKNRRVMDEAAEGWPRDTVMSSPNGGRSGSGILLGDGGADSYM